MLVLDQLNTHTPESVYAAFPPAAARRLADRLEIHHTPKHGGWLNVAEIELSVLQRQCLNRRLPDGAAVARGVAAWTPRAATPPGPPSTGTSHRRRPNKLRRLYPASET